MSHSLIYSFIVQERGVGMMFASSGGWKSVKLVDVNDEMPNLAGEVRTLPHRLCNCKTGSHCKVLDVWDESVVLM
jgi:hypothetical protein